MARLCAGSLAHGMADAYWVVALKYDHDPDNQCIIIANAPVREAA